MRILMLDNEFPPLGGGTGVVNYYLLKEMAGYSDTWVDLVTSSRSRNSFETEHFADRITIYKVPVNNQNIHHSTNPELLRYTWRGLRLCIQLVKQNRYDIAFAFAGVPAGGISYVLKKLFGLPYIVSLQGPDVPGFEARYNYLYPFLRPILRRIWGNALSTTAISQEHQQLAHQTMPRLDIPIIYNGVDTDTFCPAAEHRPGNGLNILCVGRLIERKGQHYLIQAFSALQDAELGPVRLSFVGTGDAEEQLHSLAREIGVYDRVDFKGFVRRQDMPRVYQEADIFVLPSQSEGMSIALLEAMASGLPVITTDTGGTMELVKPGGNGLVVQWGDVPGLTKALCALLKDEQLRKKMGVDSREIAEKFSWAKVTADYLGLFQNYLR
jgi:phosphatidyl-myo-inositol dimannoside synthase